LKFTGLLLLGGSYLCSVPFPEMKKNLTRKSSGGYQAKRRKEEKT
jgi:hypothetical protein